MNDPSKFSHAVYTSDVSGAGTEADVYVVLYGRDGMQTEQTSLCNNKDERKSKFKKKAISTVCPQMFWRCYKTSHMIKFPFFLPTSL